jgi:hypothetical protein
MPVKVLLADSERPIRYETELREVSLESGENIINLQITRVPSEIIVGGLKFQYQDLELSKYLDKGEKYRVGEYYGGDTVSYNYYGLGALKHQYNYWIDPSMRCASMNLSYKGKSYAPVRIYKVLEEKQGDGTTEVTQETVGHLFIDRQGNVIGGDDALETLYVIHLGMHTFGTPTKARLREEISFYKSLRGVVQNMAGKFDNMIKAGLALKGLETAVSVYLDLTVSGDWTGAAITTASSAIFFKQIIDRTDPDNIHKPQTLEDVSKAVETVKLTKTWYDGAQLVGKLDDLKRLKGPHSATALKRLFPAWDAMNPTELEKQLESAKLETSDKKDILGLAYDTFQLVEQSDEHTQKAVAWKIQAAGLIAMLNEIIEVLEGIQNGMATAAEAENVMTLKYLCSNMTMGYALLLEDVIKTNEFRKHWTFSGNIYRGLRGTAEKLGVVSEHSTEGAEQLIAAFKGDGTEQNPGMAYYQMQGYYLDTALASHKTKWTLERVKEKQTQTQ